MVQFLIGMIFGAMLGMFLSAVLEDENDKDGEEE